MEQTDNELISYSLNFWANLIETRDFCLSAQDARNMNKKNIIQTLSLEQHELVVRLRKMALKHRLSNG